MTEYQAGRAWADACVGRIYGGSDEIMKEIIARTLKGNQPFDNIQGDSTMAFTRRKPLGQWLPLIALPAACGMGGAHVQDSYPNKPIRLIVPFPVGGGTDTIARLLGQQLTQRWGQSVVVENKPGASGLLAGEAVVRSTPDGTTLLLGSTSSMLSKKYIYKKRHMTR